MSDLYHKMFLQFSCTFYLEIKVHNYAYHLHLISKPRLTSRPSCLCPLDNVVAVLLEVSNPHNQRPPHDTA